MYLVSLAVIQHATMFVIQTESVRNPTTNQTNSWPDKLIVDSAVTQVIYRDHDNYVTKMKSNNSVVGQGETVTQTQNNSVLADELVTLIEAVRNALHEVEGEDREQVEHAISDLEEAATYEGSRKGKAASQVYSVGRRKCWGRSVELGGAGSHPGRTRSRTSTALTTGPSPRRATAIKLNAAEASVWDNDDPRNAPDCTLPFSQRSWGSEQRTVPKAPHKVPLLRDTGCADPDNVLAKNIKQLSGMPCLVQPNGDSFQWSPYRYAVYLHWMRQTADRLQCAPDARSPCSRDGAGPDPPA